MNVSLCFLGQYTHLDFFFYRKLEWLLIIFPIKSRFWWVAWSNLHIWLQPTMFPKCVFCDSDALRLPMYCSLHIHQVEFSSSLTSLWFCFTSFRKSAINFFILYWAISFWILKVLIVCITHFLFNYTDLLLFSSLWSSKILWTIRFSNCIRTKALVSNTWPLCSSYRYTLGRS